LLDARAQGGLGLDDQLVGKIYGIYGIIALTLGGILGGFVVSQRGVKFWLWPMLLAIHLPDAVFIWLASAQPQNLFAIGAGVAVEQFGYGFGFTAMLLYMIYIARGEHATAHYAICTGYAAFFVWVIFATIPSFIVTMKIPLDVEFGKRTRAN
jgi:MFS transporter, PAT family, beta-lactamase induction signal transducer AmpG